MRQKHLAFSLQLNTRITLLYYVIHISSYILASYITCYVVYLRTRYPLSTHYNDVVLSDTDYQQPYKQIEVSLSIRERFIKSSQESSWISPVTIKCVGGVSRIH